MRILMMDPRYFSKYGAQLTMVDIARRIKDQGNEVVIMTSKRGPLSEMAVRAGLSVDVRDIPPGLDVFEGKIPKMSVLGKLSVARDIVRYGLSLVPIAKRYDVLYANDLRAALYFLIPAIITRRPIVWYVQGGYSYGLPSAIAAVFSSRVLLVSAGSVKAIPAVLQRLVRKKVGIAYTGVDSSTLLPYPSVAEKERLRSDLGLPRRKVIIASVGSLTRRKGFDVLLEAVARLAERRPHALDFHVVIVGDAVGGESVQYARKLRERAAERGLPVSFLGWRDDVPRVLAASDIFVLASREEGLPRVVLEAMGTGLPAIVTRIGGPEEAVGDGRTGFVVERDDPASLGDRMEYLIENPDERSRMGLAGLTRFKELFTAEAQVQAVTAALANAIRRRT